MSDSRPSDSEIGPNPSRRQLLRGGVTASTVALIPLVNTSCSTPPPPPSTPLGADIDAVLTAVADRLFPADELGPAASALGVITYIHRSLTEWNQADVPMLSAGLRALDQAALNRHGLGFTVLNADQQDALLMALEANELAEISPGTTLFNRVHRLVLEGVFSDPYYGGNRNFQGWDMIGYPGAVLASTTDMQKMGQRLPALHTSAYGAEHDGH